MTVDHLKPRPVMDTSGIHIPQCSPVFSQSLTSPIA